MCGRQDISLRAIDLLRQVSLIVVQNAAVARPYLRELGADAPLVESTQAGAEVVILEALEGGDVAWLVGRLTELCGPALALSRALLNQGVDLVSVPGGSAE